MQADLIRLHLRLVDITGQFISVLCAVCDNLYEDLILTVDAVNRLHECAGEGVTHNVAKDANDSSIANDACDCENDCLNDKYETAPNDVVVNNRDSSDDVSSPVNVKF